MPCRVWERVPPLKFLALRRREGSIIRKGGECCKQVSYTPCCQDQGKLHTQVRVNHKFIQDFCSEALRLVNTISYSCHLSSSSFFLCSHLCLLSYDPISRSFSPFEIISILLWCSNLYILILLTEFLLHFLVFTNIDSSLKILSPWNVLEFFGLIYLWTPYLEMSSAISLLFNATSWSVALCFYVKNHVP